MRVAWVNAFLEALDHVLLQFLGLAGTHGALTATPRDQILMPVTVILGLTGALRGNWLLGTDLPTAQRLAARMMSQATGPLSELSCSALGELGNIVSGQALIRLESQGLCCDICPPTVLLAQQAQLSQADPERALVVPVTTELGTLHVFLAFVGTNAP